ncbi:MAG: energy-coupling factor transporter ATPase [Tissierellia bacterium]|nr:energy-coupling factor transporter ATPase [Tissierellia bacterium]
MLIEIRNLNYIYNIGSPFEVKALDNVNLSIDKGEFVAIIGHTGSGKSTLVQHLNGLIKPTSGEIIVDGHNLTDKETKLNIIRQKVGLVFQYPEHQLFEETVYKDIAFGPANLKLSEEEIDFRVKDSMKKVGLDFEELKDKSPFELSGGQKRRVAIAGVLAMEPSVLVLDEPTAGLDPYGRDEILEEIKNIFTAEGIAIVLVSHSMEDVAKLVDRILVMNHGKIIMDGAPREVFKNQDELESIGLSVPQITKFMKALKERGFDLNTDCITVEEARDEIKRYLERN